MKVEIVERNYHASEKLEQVLLKKLNKLDRYFGDDITAKVVLSQSGRRPRLELSIPYYGLSLRAEAEEATMYHNIDVALPKLERQVLKHADKLNRRKRLPEVQEYAFVAGVEEEPQPIVKTKEFDVTVLSREDAVAELDLSDHDFYLFVNEESGAPEVVYRREDGTVGLLKPRIK